MLGFVVKIIFKLDDFIYFIDYILINIYILFLNIKYFNSF